MHYEQLSREALMAVLMGPIPTDLAEAASAAEPAAAAAPCQETAVLVSQHKALCPPCPPVQTEPRQALEAALDLALDLPLPVRHRLGAARELILRTLGQRLAGAGFDLGDQQVLAAGFAHQAQLHRQARAVQPATGERGVDGQLQGGGQGARWRRRLG